MSEGLARIRAVFATEGQELLEQFRSDLDRLAAVPADAECRERLARGPHTICSGAGMIGEDGLAELAELVESCARLARDGGFALSPRHLEALRAGHDALAARVAALTGGPVPTDAAPAVAALREAFGEA